MLHILNGVAYLSKKADEDGKVNAEYKAKYRSALPYLEKAVTNGRCTSRKLGNSWKSLFSVLGMQDEAKNAFDQADKLMKITNKFEKLWIRINNHRDSS